MASLSESLATSLGSSVLAPTGQEARYGIDGLTPEAVALPCSLDQLAEALRLASENGLRVIPWGGGTQSTMGNIPEAVDLVLGTERLDRILFHEPGDMVASVEAGVTLAGLQAELGKRGQFLPLEAPISSRATIGGVLAANASGPSRLAYGTARDWLIGTTVVHAGGTITRSGGRVVKNVTGYDVHKLYVGSLGTLGVIAGANFKLAPLPAETCTVVARFSSLPRALDCVDGLFHLAYTPDSVHIVSGEASRRLPSLQADAENGHAVLVLLRGRRAAVARKVFEAIRVLRRGEDTPVDTLAGTQSEGLWSAVTDLGWADQPAPVLMAKITVQPSKVGALLSALEVSVNGPFAAGTVADAGFGLVRLLLWERGDGKGDKDEARRIAATLSQEAARAGGHLVLEVCPLELKREIDIWGEEPDGIEVMRRLKEQMDPARILSPGRFVARI